MKPWYNSWDLLNLCNNKKRLFFLATVLTKQVQSRKHSRRGVVVPTASNRTLDKSLASLGIPEALCQGMGRTRWTLNSLPALKFCDSKCRLGLFLKEFKTFFPPKYYMRIFSIKKENKLEHARQSQSSLWLISTKPRSLLSSSFPFSPQLAPGLSLMCIPFLKFSF